MPSIKSHYFKVPKGTHSLKLLSSEFSVLLYFMTLQNCKGIYPKIETIATECGLSCRTVKRAVKSLSEKELISVLSGQLDHRSNSYEIHFDEINPICITESSSSESPSNDSNATNTFVGSKKEAVPNTFDHYEFSTDSSWIENGVSNV